MFYRHAKLFTILLCYANLALALPNDREQPISLAADNATYNEKTGLAIYSGNVEIKQGSLLIQAEQITATTDKNGKILTITATGKPARLQQQPSTDKGIATAQAEEINYQAQDGLISLKRNAILQQAGSTFKSLEILYSMDKGEVEAKGNPQNRVQLVFPPPPQNDKKSKKLGESPSTVSETP